MDKLIRIFAQPIGFAGTFSSLSPVAFVVDKTTLTSATGTATSPATSATTVSAVAVLGLAAVAAAFGLKKKAVR